jgi:hypothetical protein
MLKTLQSALKIINTAVLKPKHESLVLVPRGNTNEGSMEEGIS